MDISRRNARRLAILSVLVALSIGMVVAASNVANISNKTVSTSNKITSNIGAGQTIKISITGITYLGVNQFATIANQGTSNVNLTGWKLMDKENQTYSFPASFSLKPNAVVRVHSESGRSTIADLYNSSLTWNMNGDTGTLKDASGKVISQYSYPAKAAVKTPAKNLTPVTVKYTKNTSTKGSPNTKK